MNDDGTAVVGASEPNVDYVETYAPVETRTQPRDAFVMKSIPQVQFMPPPEDKTAPKDTVDLKFLPPADSVVPKFTGSFVKAPEDKAIGFEWDVRGPITNPASFYLQGASIENVSRARELDQSQGIWRSKMLGKSWSKMTALVWAIKCLE